MGRIAAVLIAMVALSWGGVAFADPLSLSAFRDQVFARIGELDPTAAGTREGEAGIRMTKPTEMQINVENIYGVYVGDPSRHDMLIDRMARMALGRVETGRGPDALIIILRHSSLPAQPGVPDFVWRPFTGDLIEVLAFDSEEAIAYAAPEVLPEMGLSEADAWRRAEANLPEHIGQLTANLYDDMPGVALVTNELGLAPSDLVRADFCESALMSGSRFLVVQRDAYFVALGDQQGAVATLRGLARQLAANGQTLSASVLACERGHVVAEDRTQ